MNLCEAVKSGKKFRYPYMEGEKHFDTVHSILWTVDGVSWQYADVNYKMLMRQDYYFCDTKGQPL